MFTKQERFLIYRKIIKIAGIKSDLIRNNPGLSTEINFLSDNDPSGSYKYLRYCVSVLNTGQADIATLQDTIEKFHKNINKISNKDINSSEYIDFNHLKSITDKISSELSEAKRKEEVKKVGTELLYEDENITAIHVKNEDAAILYGKGTKWCVSSTDDENLFRDYDNNNKILVFIFNKKAEPNDKTLYKMCLEFFRTKSEPANQVTRVKFWNAEDKQIFQDTMEKTIPNWNNILNLLTEKVSALPYTLKVMINQEYASHQLTPENIIQATQILKNFSLNPYNKYPDETYIFISKLPSSNPIYHNLKNQIAYAGYDPRTTRGIRPELVPQQAFLNLINDPDPSFGEILARSPYFARDPNYLYLINALASKDDNLRKILVNGRSLLFKPETLEIMLDNTSDPTLIRNIFIIIENEIANGSEIFKPLLDKYKSLYLSGIFPSEKKSV